MRSICWIACAWMVVLLSSCASSSDSGSPWSREYAIPEAVVFDAVVEVLENEGYRAVDERVAGRVTAEPGRAAGGIRPTLVVRVTEKNSRVLVDVQVRSGMQGSGMIPRSTDAAVREFLHALDRRLQGFSG